MLSGKNFNKNKQLYRPQNYNKSSSYQTIKTDARIQKAGMKK